MQTLEWVLAILRCDFIFLMILSQWFFTARRPTSFYFACGFGSLSSSFRGWFYGNRGAFTGSRSNRHFSDFVKGFPAIYIWNFKWLANTYISIISEFLVVTVFYSTSCFPSKSSYLISLLWNALLIFWILWKTQIAYQLLKSGFQW